MSSDQNAQIQAHIESLKTRHPSEIDGRSTWAHPQVARDYDKALLEACKTPYEVGLIVADRLGISGYEGNYSIDFNGKALIARGFMRLGEILREASQP